MWYIVVYTLDKKFVVLIGKRFKVCWVCFLMGQEKVWNTISGKWAKFRVRPTREVVEFLCGKNGRVLDLGCGSGRHVPPWDLKFGIGGLDDLEFYGVDFSDKLLDIARGKRYTDLKIGYTWDVPYDDEFFDYVVFSRVLHCVDSAEGRRGSLEEVWRVLRSGGEALITSWGKKGRERLGGEKEGFVSWDVDGEKVMRYTYVYDLDELRRELEDIGFEILSLDDGDNLVAWVRKL